MLTAFGTFFAGEGLGVEWWSGDWALLGLIAGYALASYILMRLVRWRPAEIIDSKLVRMLRVVAMEVWGLFVTDGLLAILAVVALVVADFSLKHTAGQKPAAGLLLVAGVLIALGISLWAAARRVVANRVPTGTPEEEANIRQ